MKYKLINSAILLVAIINTSIVNAVTKGIPNNCNVASTYADKGENQSTHVHKKKDDSVSFEYINDEVKGSYNTMRDGVISHVKKEVVLSLLNFGVDGFAPENIAAYVSNATKPFLPFNFANNVKIIDVTHKGRTIVYKAEMPIHKNHDHAMELTKAGIASASDMVCNDSSMIEDLLERNVVIRYDYYDTDGVFMCSFDIKDGR
ncbi:MAG: hypothetical protein V3U87_05650 [Methylococcaceae bacterium]